MSNTEKKQTDDELSAAENSRNVAADDPLADTSSLMSHEIPPGVDRRSFLIRSAVGGAAAVMVGRAVSVEARTEMAIATLPQQAKGAPAKGAPAAGSAPALAKDLDVVKKGQGPVLTTVDEFYRSGRVPPVRTRSGRCALPTISTSAPPNCRPTNCPRRRR
jgi:hypothetical protein